PCQARLALRQTAKARWNTTENETVVAVNLPVRSRGPAHRSAAQCPTGHGVNNTPRPGGPAAWIIIAPETLASAPRPANAPGKAARRETAGSPGEILRRDRRYLRQIRPRHAGRPHRRQRNPAALAAPARGKMRAKRASAGGTHRAPRVSAGHDAVSDRRADRLDRHPHRPDRTGNRPVRLSRSPSWMKSPGPASSPSKTSSPKTAPTRPAPPPPPT